MLRVIVGYPETTLPKTGLLLGDSQKQRLYDQLFAEFRGHSSGYSAGRRRGVSGQC